MTTFSTALKLELPGDGQQSGTWGQTTNKNLGTLLEQAITGVQSITMLDANYTLTSLNGVADEARNAVLVLAGTNAAIRNVIIPSTNKTYTVVNNTVGGFAVIVKTASGTGYSVPNGGTVPLYCDGTEVYLGQTVADTQSNTDSSQKIATTAFVRSIIPAGLIMLWSGSAGAIPSGWLLCNGTSGTPDLRDRFIVGAGSTYSVGATGGSATTTLSTANLPSHTHNYSGSTGGMNANNPHSHGVYDPGHNHGGLNAAAYPDTFNSSPYFPNNAGVGTGYNWSAATGIGIYNSDINHGHAFSGTTDGGPGSSSSFTNLPPYYALCYIMKA